MAARAEFTRLFWELTEPLNKREVAKRIGVTPSYVSQLRQGTNGPSRDLLDRIIEAFELDRATWLRAAGFRVPGEPMRDPEDVLIERLAPKVAAFLGHEARSAAAVAWDGIARLRAAYSEPLHVGGELFDCKDVDEVCEHLTEIERKIRIKQGLPPEGGIFT